MKFFRILKDMADGSNRWCFERSAYQHVAFDRIDWTAMTQQRIKMKETHTIHHQSNKFAISSINEEAPMDLDNDSHRDYNSNWNITQPMSSVPFYPESRFVHAYNIIMGITHAQKYFTNTLKSIVSTFLVLMK